MSPLLRWQDRLWLLVELANIKVTPMVRLKSPCFTYLGSWSESSLQRFPNKNPGLLQNHESDQMHLFYKAHGAQEKSLCPPTAACGPGLMPLPPEPQTQLFSYSAHFSGCSFSLFHSLQFHLSILSRLSTCAPTTLAACLPAPTTLRAPRVTDNVILSPSSSSSFDKTFYTLANSDQKYESWGRGVMLALALENEM